MLPKNEKIKNHPRFKSERWDSKETSELGKETITADIIERLKSDLKEFEVVGIRGIGLVYRPKEEGK